MKKTIAFDVYGTLIDVSALTKALAQYVGSKADKFTKTWRAKQLEYAFRRGLMNNYCDFAKCTEQALDYTEAFLDVPLVVAQKQHLLELYHSLPCFADVTRGLTQLQQNGYNLVAFSNGSAADVEQVLGNAAVRNYFSDIVSVEDVKSFKPDPAVYQHLMNRTKTEAEQCWLISSNAFDVIGALNIGMRSAWVKRSDDAVFDPWGIEPTLVVNDIAELAQRML